MDYKKELEKQIETLSTHEKLIYMNGYSAGFNYARKIASEVIPETERPECWCGKCGDNVLCGDSHNSNEPHRKSLCGNCT